MKPTVFNYQEYERVVEENKKLNAEVADLRIRIADGDKRDCKFCKHQKADGCSRWNCEYEPRMDGLISRQDAIDVIMGEPTDAHYPSWYADKIKSLPSADEQDNNRLYIKIYADDEPSRKAEKLYQICGETENQEVAQWIKEYFPSTDRPTGKWIKSNILPNGWHCSHCDSPVMTDDIEEMLFCPNCGAKMGGEGSE